MARSITVQRIGVSSIARLIGTVNLIIGLVVGFLGAVVAIVSYLGHSSNGWVADTFSSVGILLIGVIVYPLILFAFGWLYGALVALIFNLVIGVSGGVELTVADDGPVRK